MNENRLNTIINPTEDFNRQRPMDVKLTLRLLDSYGQKFWSWGVHACTNIQNQALRFMVHGHHHKGHVYISVNSCDLYDIVLTSPRGKIKFILNDIYVDDLFEILDEKIEYISEYGDN